MKLIKSLLILFLFNTVVFSQDLQKVSLQLQWKHQFEFAGFYMAKEKGFYKNVGLDVKVKEYNFGTNIVKDVENGKTTFGTSYPSVILQKANGKDIVLLSAILQSSPHILISLKSNNIKSIKDFKNKKIMILDNATQTVPFISMLESNKISIDDMIKIKQTFTLDDLLNGKVDITTAFASNELYYLDKREIKYNIWDPKDYGFDFYDVILFTSSNELKKHPEKVANFRKASLKGWKYAFDNIEETVDLILKKYNTQHKTKDALIYEAKVLKKLAFNGTKTLGNIDKNKIQRIFDIYNLIGLAKDKINFDNFIYDPLAKESVLTLKEKEYLKNKQIINMCIDPHWMPFEKFDKYGKHIGMSADYFKTFQEKIGIRINPIKTISWEQTLEFAKQRRCDIISLAMKTPTREKYLNFTRPYLKVPLVIATKTQVPFINDITVLDGKKIGITKGYAFVEILKNKYPKLNIIEVENIKDGLEKVNKGELFAYIGTLASIGYKFQKGFTGELKIAGKLSENWELGVAVRNDDPILLDIFNKLVNSVDENMKQKILNNWISINYEKGIDYKIIWNILIVVFIIIIFFVYRQYILNRSNKNLQKIVDSKTQDLKLLNENLEIQIKKEVQKNLKIQEQLFQSEKMAAMGEMIGNISHQWRQPLSVISTAATGIKIRKEFGGIDEKEEFETLDSINEAAQFLSKTIDDFRNFLKPNKEVIEFNMKDTYKKSLSLISSKLKNKEIEIIETLEDVKIIGLENEFIQVVINLLNNSIDALELNNIEKKYIFVHLYKMNNRTFLEIRDNANGIPDDIIHKVFEPYFTTKHKSQGTGIGLYMTQEIIVNHMNGNITVENCEFEYDGKKYIGAKFTICLEFE